MGRSRVAVVGAGAFGGWTALWCARAGARVSLFEAWGPGHGRSSSGGETRLIRCGYGPRQEFTELAWEATGLWDKDLGAPGHSCFHRNGVLWLFREDKDGYAAATREGLLASSVPFQELSADQVSRRWPQFRTKPLALALFEPQAGYLSSRRACQEVVRRFQAEGGDYHQGLARLDREKSGPTLLLEDGSRHEADALVFACGPWLSRWFPEVAAARLQVTRQEVYYFATPPGARWSEAGMPCWIDYTEHLWYGMPENDGRGFKLGEHLPGPPMDPDTEERLPSPAGLQRARAFLASAFPELAGAASLGAEVCPYELAAEDRPFCLQHPERSQVWLLGGGSGHGYKLGPALGRRAARAILRTSDV